MVHHYLLMKQQYVEMFVTNNESGERHAPRVAPEPTTLRIPVRYHTNSTLILLNPTLLIITVDH